MSAPERFPLPWRVHQEGWRANADVMASDGSLVRREVPPDLAAFLVASANGSALLGDALGLLESLAERYEKITGNRAESALEFIARAPKATP